MSLVEFPCKIVGLRFPVLWTERTKGSVIAGFARSQPFLSFYFASRGTRNNHNFPLPPQSSPSIVQRNVIIEGTESRVQKRWRFSIFHHQIVSSLPFSSRVFVRKGRAIPIDHFPNESREVGKEKKDLFDLGNRKQVASPSGTFDFLSGRDDPFSGVSDRNI